MRVINFDGVNISVIDTSDERLAQGVEDVFKPQDFKDFFGLDYTGYISVIYEPERELYTVEKKGEGAFGYESPEDEPLLKKLALKEKDIMDYVVLRHLKQELPSKFHRIENYKISLPQANEESYNNMVLEKESWEYLNETQWYALREMETGLPQPEEVREVRALAYANLSNSFIAKKLGQKSSSGADIRAKLAPGEIRVPSKVKLMEKKVKECNPAALKKKFPNNE